MLRFLKRRKAEPGWLAVSLEPGRLAFAHGQAGANGKAAITRCGTRALGTGFEGAESAAKELGLSRYQCSTLLAPEHYRLFVVEAPQVPPPELKSAIRWRVKDLLDYHVEDATLDVLDIPADPTRGPRAHFMYVVAARNMAVQDCIARFDAARIPLKVIEIEETAQRNLAALFESPQRALALFHLGASAGLLTINHRAELCLARRIEIGMDQLLGARENAREELLGRIALEVQRTFDHFERQFPFVALEKLLLGPEPAPSGLEDHLARNLAVPVERARLGEVLRFSGQARLDAQGEWRLFHLLGAALRSEEKVL